MPVIDLDETLDFHLPGKVGETKLSEEPELLYRQLVCWCLVQRFWYYCCGNPQVSDHEYDYHERCVAELEQDYGFENEYSPTVHPGSDHRLDYPGSIHNFFSSQVLGGMTAWQYRIKYRISKAAVRDTDMGVGDFEFCNCDYCEGYRESHPPVDCD